MRRLVDVSAVAAVLAAVDLEVSRHATRTLAAPELVFHPRTGLWQLGMLAGSALLLLVAVSLGGRLLRACVAVSLGGLWANLAASALWAAGVPDYLGAPWNPLLRLNAADLCLVAGVVASAVVAALASESPRRRRIGYAR